MDDAANGLLLAMAVEIAELRQKLAEVQDLLVETAIDAGHLHARIEDLRVELAEARRARRVAGQSGTGPACGMIGYDADRQSIGRRADRAPYLTKTLDLVPPSGLQVLQQHAGIRGVAALPF